MKADGYKKYIIDVNVYEIIQKAYTEHFERGINKVGCSGVAFCIRNILITKLFFPGEFEGNMKMLHGHIHHEVIQNKKVLKPLLKAICEELGFNPRKLKYKVELQFDDEIVPDKPYTGLLKGKKTYLQGHIDVYTNFFILEIKTTSVPLKYYSDKIAPFHFIQSNTYMGKCDTRIPKSKYVTDKLAYLLSLNLRAYASSDKSIKEIWRKYGNLIPIKFDPIIFDKTMVRIKLIFRMLDEERFNLAGPEFDWECRTCDTKVKKICGREIKK